MVPGQRDALPTATGNTPAGATAQAPPRQSGCDLLLTMNKRRFLQIVSMLPLIGQCGFGWAGFRRHYITSASWEHVVGLRIESDDWIRAYEKLMRFPRHYPDYVITHRFPSPCRIQGIEMENYRLNKYLACPDTPNSLLWMGIPIIFNPVESDGSKADLSVVKCYGRS